MLHHRLAFEPQNTSRGSAEAAYAVEQIPRVATNAVAAAMLAVDLAGCVGIRLVVSHGSGLPSSSAPIAVLAWLAVPATLWLASAYVTKLYDDNALRAGNLQLLPALATSCLCFAPSLAAREFADTGTILPSTVLTAFLWQLALAASLRGVWGIVLGRLLRRGYCLEKVALLSRSMSAARVLGAILEHRTKGRLRVAVSATIPRLGDTSTLAWLEGITHSQDIDRIVLADDLDISEALHETAAQLACTGVDITILSKSRTAYRVNGRSSDLPSLDEDATPLSPWQLASKRAVDVCVAVLASLALSPLLLLLAALVRLDSKGPALFRQTRQGLGGRPFEILKFRSMHTHMADAVCAVQTSRGDPRVTRVGRLLRSSSLDELPQLFNVLRGEMSIIGPRPHALGMHVEGKPMLSAVVGYEVRLKLKPGITGWAQVNGFARRIDGRESIAPEGGAGLPLYRKLVYEDGCPDFFSYNRADFSRQARILSGWMQSGKMTGRPSDNDHD